MPTSGQRLRVQVVRAGSIESGAGTAPAIVAIGLPTADVANTVHRLLILELWVGLAAVRVTATATMFGVRLSLRRLRRVTQLAFEIAAEVGPEGGGLGKRLAVNKADAGTEVGQLATSVNTLLAVVQVQFAERMRSEDRMRQFLFDASHELRTPLTSIRGYAELARLRRDQEARGTSSSGDNLERIEAEGIRMSHLVDDLLSLARNDGDTELRGSGWTWQN